MGRVKEIQTRIAEIDVMFEAAKGWGSWMMTASHERRDLVRELARLGVDVEHKWEVRYG